VRLCVFVGIFASDHGFCTGLVLDGGNLIVSGLQDGANPFLIALNKRTGDSVWKAMRPHPVRSFSTPLLCNFDGKPAIILSCTKQTIVYDRANGQTLYEVDGPSEKTVYENSG